MATMLTACGDDFGPEESVATQIEPAERRVQARRLAADCVRFFTGHADRGAVDDADCERGAVDPVPVDRLPVGRPTTASDLFAEDPGLSDRIEAYLDAAPADWGADVDQDAERFLEWICPLSGESVDPEIEAPGPGDDAGLTISVAEFAALKQRLSHARFQRRWRAGLERLDSLTCDSRQHASLNPIHVWATFEPSPAGAADDGVRSDVLFFPVGQEVRSVLVGSDAAELLRCLQRRGSVPVRTLVRAVDGEPDETLELVRRLAGLGMLAIG